MVRRTGFGDAILAERIYEMLRVEMKKSNLAIKDFESIKQEIVEGRAFIAIDSENEIVGYISYHPWQCGIEIMSLTVRNEYRKQGWGSRLVAEMRGYLQKKFPERDIIAMANQNSGPIILRNDFGAFSKFAIAAELREACAGCSEEFIFPDCHCQPLILIKPGLTRIVGLPANGAAVTDMVELYCRIWREPPWNEDFWTPEKVNADLASALRHPKSICLAAVNGDKVRGFTWGYDIDSDELRFIAGHDYFDVFYGRKLFYLAELGVDKNCRKRGIGKKLTLAIINFAKTSGREIILLRTDNNALAAQTVYKKFGFIHILIPDGHHPSRSYWALKLRQ